MSYLGAAVTVHRSVDPPDTAGPPPTRSVAPCSVTAGRFGLFVHAIRNDGVDFYARHDQVDP